ncbi:MAG: FHA domain-containing protein [Planctomycetota bacterium]|nr:FHA domain-containing protein [Planctomycetota bacterium]
MPAIRVTNGPQKGTIYQIEDVGIVIGKASECDIQLYDAMVEQMHARIYRMGEMYFIRNLAESGSTYVNDEQITEELLREGDQIRVGSTGLAFDSSRATVRAVEESDYVLSDFMLDVDDDDILSPSMEVPDGGSRLQRDMHIIREFIELGTEQKTANQYMDTATDFVMKNVGCDVAAILLRQPDGRTKLGAATRRQKSASSVADVIALYAMKNRKALLIADAEGDARFKHSPSVADAHVHSVVCIPMFVRDEAKGCLYLGNDELNGVFPLMTSTLPG